MHTSWAQAIAAGAQEQAHKSGAVLEHLPADRPAERIVNDGPYQGLITSDTSPDTILTILEPLMRVGVRCVHVSTNTFAKALLPTLTIDAVATGRFIGSWAIQRGYQHLAMAMRANPVQRARHQGAEASFGTEVPFFKLPMGAPTEHWRHALRTWWATVPPATLLVAEAPMTALRIYNALSDYRPHLLAAQDDQATLSTVTPTISAVTVDFAELGRRAVQRLLQSKVWPPAIEVERLQPDTLVERDTTKHQQHPLEQHLRAVVHAAFPQRVSVAALAEASGYSRRQLERAHAAVNLAAPGALAAQAYADELQAYLQQHPIEPLCTGTPFPSERALKMFVRRWRSPL